MALEGMSGNHRERAGERDGAGGDTRDDRARAANRGVAHPPAFVLLVHRDERAPQP
jgi:hypothetical protein